MMTKNQYKAEFLRAIIAIAEDKGVFTCKQDTPPECDAYLRSFEGLPQNEDDAAEGEKEVWALLQSLVVRVEYGDA